MKNIKAFLAGAGLALVAILLIAAVPAFQDFNTNQFITTGNKVAMRPARTNNLGGMKVDGITTSVDVNGMLTAIGAAATATNAAGANNELQWRNPTNGTFGASSGLSYDNTNGALQVSTVSSLSSTLDLTAAGSSLLLGSGGLTLSGASGGFIGLGQNLTALNASQLTSGTVPYTRLPVSTFYISQESGASDSNAGTNSAKPWLTIAKLYTALGNPISNARIIAHNSGYWREALVFGTNYTLETYGAGPGPTFDASDVATNSLFTLQQANVWKYSWVVTGGQSAADRYLSVVEDGIQLVYTNSIANCALLAGSFFTTNVNNPAEGSTNIVFVHPRGNTSPTNDAKLYEMAKRDYAIVGGDNGKILGPLRTRNNFGGGGSLRVGRNAFVSKVLSENGTKHNILIASGVVEDSMQWKQEYALQSANPFVGFDTVDGGTLVVRRNSVIDCPKGSAYYSHTETNGYAFMLFEDVIAENCLDWGSAGVMTNGVAVYNRISGRNLANGMAAYGGTHILLNPRFVTDYAVGGGSRAIVALGNGSAVWVSGAETAGFTYSLLAQNVTNTTINVHQSDFGSSVFLADLNSGVTVSASNNIMNAWQLGVGTTISGANSNVFPSGGSFTVNGTTYGSFGAYQAANPTLDVQSKTNDMQRIGDPSRGNFDYSLYSPAVTNRSGPRWGLAARPAGVPQLENVVSRIPDPITGDYTIADARLSSNVALKDAANTFSALNTFSTATASRVAVFDGGKQLVSASGSSGLMTATGASVTDSSGLAGQLSDETGSVGGFVRAGAPTIITPLIDDYLEINEETAPATPGSGKFRIYAKSSDSKLYGKNDAGTEFDLTASGVGGGSGPITNGPVAYGNASATNVFSVDPNRFDFLGGEFRFIGSSLSLSAGPLGSEGFITLSGGVLDLGTSQSITAFKSTDGGLTEMRNANLVSLIASNANLHAQGELYVAGGIHSGGSGAGRLTMPEGSAPSLAANAITLYAPVDAPAGGLGVLTSKILTNDYSVPASFASSVTAQSFSGDGSDVTGISAANITTDTIDTARLPSTVVTNNGTVPLNFKTNLVANITLVDLAVPYAIISTNNNFTLSGLASINTGASDNVVQWAVRHYQNTSGSTKTVTIPSTWTNLAGAQTVTLYLTNVGTLSLSRYPGFQTNYVWLSN